MNLPDACLDRIARASAARSELVLPVWKGAGKLRGMLDIDSDTPAAFTTEDEVWLTPLLAHIFGKAE